MNKLACPAEMSAFTEVSFKLQLKILKFLHSKYENFSFLIPSL